MPIRVQCPCGKQFAASDQYSGKTVKCPSCQKPVRIPAARAEPDKAPVGQAKPSLTAETEIFVKCDCGKTFSAPISLAGKSVKCPACRQLVPVPSGTSDAAPPPAPSALGTEGEASTATPTADDLLDELGIGYQGGALRGRCPSCNAVMGANAVVCLHCGYDVRRKRKVEVRRPVTQQERAAKAARRLMGARSEGRSTLRTYATPLTMAYAALVIVLGYFQLAWAGMALIALATLLLLAGGLWILVVAISDSVLQGVLCLLVPLYWLFYALLNWRNCKTPVLMQLVGLSLFLLGFTLLGVGTPPSGPV